MTQVSKRLLGGLELFVSGPDCKLGTRQTPFGVFERSLPGIEIHLPRSELICELAVSRGKGAELRLE